MDYRIDLFAIFILLGIVQSVFLCVFFFSDKSRRSYSAIFMGVMLMAIAFCNIEILLMYTGYIQHALVLVDMSEPFSFLIGPSFYLLVFTISRGSPPRGYAWHYAFAFVYLMLLLPFLFSSEDIKYNSWISSYHVDLSARPFSGDDPRWFWVTEQHTALTLFSILVYAGMSLAEVIRAFRSRNESFFKTQVPALRSLRSGTIITAVIIVLTLIIKAFHENDTGDHIFAACTAVAVYVTSFRVMSHSGFFQPAVAPSPVRARALVDVEQQERILDRVRDIMEKEKPFLNAEFSSPALAERVGVSVHALSHALNAGLGKSFFEMVAEYRIQEAKKLLLEKRHIKVEEIAELTGYNSRSSFNTAFKKLTGVTPSEFRSNN